MSGESYNGWSNYETWAAYTWLSSDEGFYNAVTGIMNGESEEEAESAIRTFMEDLHDTANSVNASDELKTMFSNIGSLWRVNWHELAEAFKE